MTPSTSPNESFRDFAYWHNRAADEEREDLVNCVKVVPLSQPTLDRLKNNSVAATSILMHHPGYKLESKISSLWQLRDIFRRSWDDLQLLLDQFDQFCRSGASTQPEHNDTPENTHDKVQKELFCLSSASKALVDVAQGIRAAYIFPGLRSV